MFERVKRFFGLEAGDPLSLDAVLTGVRMRWESAKTDRLNRGHWSGAQGQTINSDISQQGETLRQRAEYEVANNAIVKGVIRTHRNDVVGKYGPTLQVQSSNETYNSRIEEAWREWFKRPDVRGILSGAKLLRQNNNMLWNCGGYLNQIVTDRKAKGPVKMRLKPIHPRRLKTPFDQAMNPRIVLGIEYDPEGRPVAYYIEEETSYGDFTATTGKFERVPAEFMIHGFEEEEPDQAKGVSLLAPALQPVADLRDYDTQVLDAARQAADNAVLIQTTDPRIKPLNNGQPISGTSPMERRTIKALPPGYEATQMIAQQPTNNYVEYRAERMRDIGRPVGMPLMTIRGDASKHNYSSARIDNQNYDTTVECWREDLHEEPMLNRCAELLQTEVELAEGLRRPKDVQLVWIWPKRPHVDPQKEPAGEAQEMANGTLTFSEACARRGRDPQQVVAQHARDRKMFEEEGVPLPASLAGGMPEPPPEDGEEEGGAGSEGKDEKDEKDEKDSGKGGAKVVKVGGKK